MQEQAVLDRADVGNGVPLMVHLEADPEGCKRALCGAKLHGIDASDEDVDCVVCAELAQNLSWDYDD